MGGHGRYFHLFFRRFIGSHRQAYHLFAQKVPERRVPDIKNICLKVKNIGRSLTIRPGMFIGSYGPPLRESSSIGLGHLLAAIGSHWWNTHPETQNVHWLPWEAARMDEEKKRRPAAAMGREPHL